jgi:hypothetical protein
MANTRRGKKINQTKNYVAAKDFAEGKKIGRPKQEWHWDFVELNPDDTIKGGRGHWRKV